MTGKSRTQTRVRYGFKLPKYGRSTFSIYEDLVHSNGTRTCHVIRDERLHAINLAYKKGGKDLATCKSQIKEIIKDLYKRDERCRPKIVHNNENHKVLDEYWESVYSFRTLENEESTRNELNRAIDILGPLSIYSANREQIQVAIDQRFSGNVQRRLVARLTQILKFIGRSDVKLRKVRPSYNKVQHLSESDFQKLAAAIEKPALKALVELCYYSGLRIGEAYALIPNCLVGNDTIRVDSQVDRKGNYKPSTKTRKPRLAFLLSGGKAAFDTWVNVSNDEKAKINRISISKEIRAYCNKVFPNDPSKQITFHGLRHSYAIHLLVRGVSMSLVAQSLGNSLSVCQHYYVGFELTNESVAAIRALVERN